MITGENSFKIDWRDWLRGMTTSDEVEDGGFSQQTTAVNLLAQPGVINPPGAVTDKSTNLTDEIIAGTYNTEDSPTYNNLYIDASKAFYGWNGTTLTKEDTGTTNTYTQGTTMIVPFQLTANSNPTYYISTSIASADIAEWDGSSAVNEVWWSSTKSGPALATGTSWRPLLVWENQLWIGDKNILRSVDAGGNLTAPLTLGGDQAISSLGIDKATGKLLIATTTGGDISGTKKGEDRIHLYDGSSPKVDKTVRINGTITTFHNLSSSTIVFYGNKMGVWTGRGVKFLRKLNFSLGNSADLVYPNKVTSIDDTLYVVDGNQILAYGEMIGGQSPIFYNALQTSTLADITMVCNIGSGKLGYSYATSKFFTFDVNTVSAVVNGGCSVYSRRYDFNKKVNLKGVRIQCKTLPTSGTDNILQLRYIDDTETDNLVKTISTTELTTGQKEIDVHITDGFKPTSSMQFRLVMAPGTPSNVVSVKRLVVYHDPAQE